jgi:Protein of unknown function (DUF935)
MAKPLREIPSYSLGEYQSAPLLKSILREQEMGLLFRPAQLSRLMLRDSRVAGVLRTRIQGLLGSLLEMEPRGDGRRKKAVAQEGLETWDQMFPESQLARHLFWGLMLGVSFGRNLVNTNIVPGKWIPRLEVWNPGNARFDKSRKIWVMGTQDGEVDVHPDDPEWSVFAPYGFENGFELALILSIATDWQSRQWAMRDWARTGEVHGNPIRMAITPENSTEEDKERWHRQVANPGSETTYRATDGGEGRKFDIQFRELTSKPHEGFRAQIDQASTEISITVLGHNLTSEVKGGSYAAARVGDAIRSDIRQFDSTTMGTSLREGTLKRWAKWNFGDPELAPSPAWDVEPPADLKSSAETMKAVGDAFTSLRNGGLDPDVEEIADEFGIPHRGEVEPTKPQAPAAPGNTDGTPEDPAADDEGEPTESPGDTPPPKQKAAASRGAKRMKPSGASKQLASAVRSQTHNDDLADAHIQAARRVTLAQIKGVEEDIADASDPADLKRRLIRRFANMSQDKLATLIEGAMIRAELNGALAIVEGSGG